MFEDTIPLSSGNLLCEDFNTLLFGREVTNLISLQIVAAAELHLGKRTQSLATAKQGQEVATQSGDESLIARAIRDEAAALAVLNEHEEACRRLQEAASLAAKAGNLTLQAAIHRFAADVHINKGNFKEALSSAREAVEASERQGDKRNMARGLETVGTAQGVLATTTAQECQELYQEVGDPLGEERALELMAKLRAAQGKMDGALEAGEERLAVVRESCGPDKEADALHQAAVNMKGSVAFPNGNVIMCCLRFILAAAIALQGAAKFQGFDDVIASGGWHTCAIRESGEVSCWGANDHGQSNPPKGRFNGLASGKAHSCGVRVGGQVECWGSNEHRQAESPDMEFTQVACGAAHTCALSIDGRIFCWGSDEHSRSSGAPDGRFVSIAASGGHSCALKKSGEALCWGFNEYNQTDVPDQKFTQIAPGYLHTCALNHQREAVCWGQKRGDNKPPAGRFKYISSRGPFTCALDMSGRAVCWPQADQRLPFLWSPELWDRVVSRQGRQRSIKSPWWKVLAS
eukprot:symbB.v1.2.038679.t1/scaffold6119.1/size20801/1